MKIEKFYKLKVDNNLAYEHRLKDAAFNLRLVNNYWENSDYATRKKYE